MSTYMQVFTVIIVTAHGQGFGIRLEGLNAEYMYVPSFIAHDGLAPRLSSIGLSDS
jgi:hypothetical protein